VVHVNDEDAGLNENMELDDLETKLQIAGLCKLISVVKNRNTVVKNSLAVYGVPTELI